MKSIKITLAILAIAAMSACTTTGTVTSTSGHGDTEREVKLAGNSPSTPSMSRADRASYSAGKTGNK